MRTTYAPPSIKAHEQPVEPLDLRELIARTLTVFIRTDFGEHYLAPSSLWKTCAVVAVPIALIRVVQRMSTAQLNLATLVTGGSFLCYLIGFVALFGRRWKLAVFMPLVVHPVFIAITVFFPSTVSLTTFISSRTSMTFTAFAVAFMVVASFQMIRSLWRPAPHHLSAGRSWLLPFPLAHRVFPGRDGWATQLLLEPLVIALVGAALWLGTGNWFGAYMMLASPLLFDATAQRYENARRVVVTSVSTIRSGDTQMRSVEDAVSEPKPMPRGQPFVARRSSRP